MSKKAYYIDADGFPVFALAPGETDDYSVNYADWLDGSTITGTPTVVAPVPGPTVGPISVTQDGEWATVWLTAAPDLAQTIYTLTVTATDGNARIRPVTIRVKVAPRA